MTAPRDRSMRYSSPVSWSGNPVAQHVLYPVTLRTRSYAVATGLGAQGPDGRDHVLAVRPVHRLRRSDNGVLGQRPLLLPARIRRLLDRSVLLQRHAHAEEHGCAESLG